MSPTTCTGRALAVAALGLGLGACTELEKLDPDGGSGARIPDRVQTAFDVSCNIPGCHNSAAAGGLNLTATASPDIIGGQSTQSSLPLVELGNVDGSYLAIKMLPEVPEGVLRQGERMPLGGALDSEDNAIILGWIAGAELPGGGGEEDSTDDGADTDPTGEPEETSTGSTGGGGGIVACGLEDVAPDVASPFDIGDAATQIPTDVGAALEANCGCHEVSPDDVIEGAFPYQGMLHFSTIAEIQSDHMGRPVREVMLDRIDSTEPTRMPPTYYCDLGGGEVITAEDQELLVDWLTQGAPDAPNWNPG